MNVFHAAKIEMKLSFNRHHFKQMHKLRYSQELLRGAL